MLGVPFAYYLVWAYPISTSANRFQPASLPDEYKEMYALTRTLLQTYAGTGKRFYLGNWEGNWHLTHVDPNYVPTDQEVQNMIAWVDIRQKAVDDAKRETPHSGVQVYYNLQANLPAKPGIPGKRVFIGEYGFPVHGITPEEQDVRTRQVMRARLKWGCPFVLYWEMYNNEVGENGAQNGFWLIDDHETKQPVYFTHQRFYRQAQEYLASFYKNHGRPPAPEEFSRSATPWLTGKPAPFAEDLRERNSRFSTSARKPS